MFIGEGRRSPLAPHETKQIVIHVHSESTGTLGLLASVSCVTGDSENSSRWNEDHPGTDDASSLNDSVLDAIDIVPAPAPEQGSDEMAEL